MQNGPMHYLGTWENPALRNQTQPVKLPTEYAVRRFP